MTELIHRTAKVESVHLLNGETVQAQVIDEYDAEMALWHGELPLGKPFFLRVYNEKGFPEDVLAIPCRVVVEHFGTEYSANALLIDGHTEEAMLIIAMQIWENGVLTTWDTERRQRDFAVALMCTALCYKDWDSTVKIRLGYNDLRDVWRIYPRSAYQGWLNRQIDSISVCFKTYEVLRTRVRELLGDLANI